MENIIIKLILKQDGDLTLRSHGETCGIQHLSPRQLSGNSTTTGAKVGILGDPHPGLNSSAFSLARNLNSLAIDGRCRQIHPPHATFSHAQSLHSTDDMCAWLKTSSLSCAPKALTSSTHHGSSFAARDTEHFLTGSFFYLSCVVFFYLSDSSLVVHASKNPLRRSTAGWHFCGVPTSHRL